VRYSRAFFTIVACAAAFAAGCAQATEPKPSPAPSYDIGFGHVHGVDLNPADGQVYAATHHGVFRIASEGPRRIAGRYQDTMGFTIAGPDMFLASGHPDLREPGPVHLGLIISTDRAQTWTPLGLQGEADFHALTASGPTIYGWDAIAGVVMRSDDGGLQWHRGAELEAVDLDIDPSGQMHVIATTEAGLLESHDGGVTFTPVPVQPPQPLLFFDHVAEPNRPSRAGIGVDSSGRLWALAAGAWSEAGSLPGPPHAFTVANADQLLAATEEGVWTSEDAGATWSLIAPTEM
jgi:hypothetical protein